MKVTLVVDDNRVEAEVDLGAGTVTLAGREHRFKILSSVGEKVELEIGGEKALVEGWTDGQPEPIGELSVNGERVIASGIERAVAASSAMPARPATTPRPSAIPPRPAPAPSNTGAGIAVTPPMPGKVIEVRVSEGERVAAGQILLVLEAMKMRNEVASPSAGTIRDLAVSAGANVRAHETMLRIIPG